ncbi:hypothetical protein AURDEDRAFT_129608 [Auricularia subglabra TFB-10046 SS5]|uniref:Uncharacterized protein n=1 Tax=Auricularia subglabra (strain TFB-10046 / SS5) TaxID=717982 RepID=J0DAG7_AURST|nr:hypothetical protein AURDEDRAFT_129608 [Auricularia subglabra TFB-10046 SS5]
MPKEDLVALAPYGNGEWEPPVPGHHRRLEAAKEAPLEDLLRMRREAAEDADILAVRMLPGTQEGNSLVMAADFVRNRINKRLAERTGLIAENDWDAMADAPLMDLLRMRGEVVDQADLLALHMLPDTTGSDSLVIGRACVLARIDMWLAERTGQPLPPLAAVVQNADVEKMERDLRERDWEPCVFCGEKQFSRREEGHVRRHLADSPGPTEARHNYNCPSFRALWDRGLVHAWRNKHMSRVREQDRWIFMTASNSIWDEEMMELGERGTRKSEAEAAWRSCSSCNMQQINEPMWTPGDGDASDAVCGHPAPTEVRPRGADAIVKRKRLMRHAKGALWSPAAHEQSGTQIEQQRVLASNGGGRVEEVDNGIGNSYAESSLGASPVSDDTAINVPIPDIDMAFGIDTRSDALPEVSTSTAALRRKDVLLAGAPLVQLAPMVPLAAALPETAETKDAIAGSGDDNGSSSRETSLTLVSDEGPAVRSAQAPTQSPGVSGAQASTEINPAAFKSSESNASPAIADPTFSDAGAAELASPPDAASNTRRSTRARKGNGGRRKKTSTAARTSRSAAPTPSPPNHGFIGKKRVHEHATLYALPKEVLLAYGPYKNGDDRPEGSKPRTDETRLYKLTLPDEWEQEKKRCAGLPDPAAALEALRDELDEDARASTPQRRASQTSARTSTGFRRSSWTRAGEAQARAAAHAPRSSMARSARRS